MKPILSAAARRIGLKAKDVIVKITASRHKYVCHGNAERYRWGVKEWFLKRGSKSDKVIQCSGFIWIRIPINTHPQADPLRIAESFLKTAIHEFVHILDMHNREYFGEYDKKWKNRPHELRAINATDEALEKGITPRIQEAIVDLGIAVEDEVQRVKDRYTRPAESMPTKIHLVPYLQGRIKAWEACFEGEPGHDLRLVKSSKDQIVREMELIIQRIEQRLAVKFGEDLFHELNEIEIQARCIIGWCCEVDESKQP